MLLNYFFDGQCNIDKTKNLRGTFYVDTNAFEELGFSTAAQEDAAYARWGENNFFVEVLNTTSTAEFAYKVINNNNGNYHYNENLQNIKVIERFDNFGDIYFGANTLSSTPPTLVNASDKAYKNIFSFTKAISDEDYKAIKNDITNSITFNINNSGLTKTGWIKRMSRKFATTETDLEIRS